MSRKNRKGKHIPAGGLLICVLVVTAAAALVMTYGRREGEQEETEQSRRIERLQKELDLEKAKKASVPQAVSLGFLPVSRLEAGSRIRIDGKEYLVEEQSRPLIRLKDPDSGQESRIHFLLQVEALAYPPDIPPSKLPGKGYCPAKESHSTCK